MRGYAEAFALDFRDALLRIFKATFGQHVETALFCLALYLTATLLFIIAFEA
jgi:hypothetical protein